jgi:hypothetical protein
VPDVGAVDVEPVEFGQAGRGEPARDRIVERARTMPMRKPSPINSPAEP